MEEKEEKLEELKQGEIQQPPKAWGKKQGLFVAICVALILVLFYLMELCTGDPSMLMMPVALLNPLLLLVVVYIFTTLFNNLKGGMILTLLLMLVFTVTDICAQSFRGVPLLAPDLLIAGTALSVADRFHFSPDTHLKIFMTADVLGIFLVGFFPANVKFRGKGRRNQAIIAALLLCGCVYLFGFSGLLEKAGVTVSHFNPQKSYASNGAVLTFIRSGQMAILQKPEGYSQEEADAILADYVDAYLQDDATYKKPNVIVMMNEAFSDVQSVGKGFETNEDVMPFIRSLEENTVKGTAYSSVFGGYTANSEYEFLTGLSMEDLGGVAPFQFLIKKPMESLVTDLASEGYGGLSAMHPFLRDGYQRPLAYENLGFSSFLGLEDIEDRDHELLRGYVSDASDVDELIRMYEEAKKESEGPVFLYNVTMQNHAPYDGDYEDLPKDIQVTDSEVKSKVLTNYLNLIKCSDAAFEKLVKYFEEQPEDTVIVMFGDHEPKLGNKFYKKMLGKKIANLTAEESMERYKVPYVIWTNYDIEEKDYGTISLNYLSSIMADAAGMKKSPLQRYLWDLRKTLPIITSQGCYDQNGFLEPEQAEDIYKDLLMDYRSIRYRRLQGEE